MSKNNKKQQSELEHIANFYALLRKDHNCIGQHMTEDKKPYCIVSFDGHLFPCEYVDKKIKYALKGKNYHACTYKGDSE